MYDRAVAGQTKVLGAEHETTLMTVMNLAILLAQRKQYDEAELLYLRALHGYEATLGEEYRMTLMCVGNLGMLYKKQGKLVDAESKLDEALAIYRASSAKGETLVDSAAALGNKASALFARGSLDEAFAVFERAYNIYQQAGAALRLEQMTIRARHACAQHFGEEHARTRAVDAKLAEARRAKA